MKILWQLIQVKNLIIFVDLAEIVLITFLLIKVLKIKQDNLFYETLFRIILLAVRELKYLEKNIERICLRYFIFNENLNTTLAIIISFTSV